jgi:hypothetical protein
LASTFFYGTQFTLFTFGCIDCIQGREGDIQMDGEKGGEGRGERGGGRGGALIYSS